MGWLIFIVLVGIAVSIWWMFSGRFLYARKASEVEQRVDLKRLEWETRLERFKQFFR